VLAVVAVLVGRAAVRADALDVTVGQEHALDRVEQLRHCAAADMAVVVELGVDRLGQLAVVRGVGRVVMVDDHAEVAQVAFV
jgi:hypothetical protein